ncbi:MAG: imidazolonepropionase [Oligoflexia bacterium]|nr:imidazolonepropionase [Oligoflexia bacterium]
MPVLRNIGLLARCLDLGGQADIQEIRSAAIAWRGEKITWIGPEAEIPQSEAAEQRFDAHGKLVVPGLIDCHTHLAFAGWRADEFEQRLVGQTYEEIAKRGGGILSTVRATRAASADELLQHCLHILREMARLGITTVECKSGYGLSCESEIKILQTYKALQQKQPLTLVPTFLGAHTIAPEYKNDRTGYVELIVKEMLPAVATQKLTHICDAFLESVAFSAAETEQIFECAVAHGMRVKLHADQLSNHKGAERAAKFKALSADHLEHVSDAGVKALKASGTVAVLLPLASLYTQQPPLAAEKLRSAGVRIAIATDFNPGTAPSYHLPFAMTLACLLHKMTPAEVLKAVTINAAHAIGLANELGSLEAGKRADFALIDATDVNHWLYHCRANACLAVYKSGNRLNLA